MKKQVIEQNNALINAIAPIGIWENKNVIEIGENYGKVYGVIKYPDSPKYGWLSKISNIPHTIFGYSFVPIDSTDFIEALNKNIGKDKGLAIDGGSELIRQRADKRSKDGTKLMIQLDMHNEPVGLLSSLIMPMGAEKELLEEAKRKTTSNCTIAKCKPRLLSGLQLSAFRQMSPMYATERNVTNITGRPVPLSAVMGGFANASSGYNDNEGFYVAKDVAGGLVVLSFWMRADDRTNSNITVMGTPGQGKSTAIKSILLSEYMMGTKLIIVDPEHEYRELCKGLKGDWINAAGGSRGRINPLEIQPLAKDEEEEEEEKLFKDEGHGMGNLALYIQHLAMFFKIFIPSLTDLQIELLKSTLIELYNKFNITWETDITKLRSSDYPIFSDLYKLLCRKSEEKEKTRKESDANHFETLSILLKDVAEGSLSGLWNGYTTISAESKCVCIGTKALQEMPDNVKCAQYFLLNSWIWKEMSYDREEKVMVAWDEAYLAIDPKVPHTLGYLRNMSKRCRKYESGLIIITQSVVDFLDPAVKRFGQALLDNAAYKILFGTDGEELNHLKKIFKLKDAEEALLSKKQQRHALMIVGSRRMHVEFDIPDYKFAYVGKAGGR